MDRELDAIDVDTEARGGGFVVADRAEYKLSADPPIAHWAPPVL